jgi:hypothetical protein
VVCFTLHDSRHNDRLREIEVMANSAFDAFRDMYYMGGYSSVYFWDLDDGFASCWLIKKASDPTIKSGTKQIPRYTVRYGTASQPAPAAVSQTARYPKPHGIPNRTVSQTARYRRFLIVGFDARSRGHPGRKRKDGQGVFLRH